MKIAGQDHHPHENNNKDNGPQPTIDAEQYMRDEHAEIIAEIRNEIANRDIDSFSGLQALADRVFQRRNSRPRDEFCGLSADQMYRLLHIPPDFSEIAEFSDNFPNPPEAPALALVSLLVDACGDKGLKGTARGYLPALFCREVATVFLEEEGYKQMTFGSEVRKELDFRELHVVRLVAQMAGLIRKYRGRFLRTKKCEKFLSSPSNGKLYLELFTAYTRKFNWAYNDWYDDLYIIQEAFLFSLFLIHRFGNEFRCVTFYEEKFLQAFPAVLDKVSDRLCRSKEEHVRLSYSLRTMKRFARFFGLIELDSNSSMLIRQSYKIKKSTLLDQLLSFHV